MIALSHRERRERGAALVEFALVSIVLYLLLAGAIEFGRIMFDANALQDAVPEEGVLHAGLPELPR